MKFSANLLIMFLLLSLMISCTEKESKPDPDPDPNPKIITPEPGAEPLNEYVKKTYEEHKDKCGKFPQGPMNYYNETYVIMEWIKKHRNMDYKEFPPICTPKEDQFSKSLFGSSNEKDIITNRDLRFAIGLKKEFEDNVLTQEKQKKTKINGYYDTGNNWIVIPFKGSIKEDTLAHELTHALQDQYYDLEAFIIEGLKRSFDERKAREAVYESDAELMRIIYMANKNNKEIPEDTKYLDYPTKYIKEYLNGADEKWSEGSTSPYELNDTNYLFTYVLTIPFLRHSMEDQGERAEILFNAPPISTEQVLHPEKYESGEKGKTFDEFSVNSLDSFFSKVNYKQVDDQYQSLGELGLTSLLSVNDMEITPPEGDSKWAKVNNLDETPFDNAFGWNGDRSLVYSPTEKSSEFDWKDTVFILISNWDNADDANNYFENLDRMIKAKYTNNEPLTGDTGGTRIYKITMEGKDPKFVIIKQTEDSTIMVERLTEKQKDEGFIDIFVNIEPNA